MSGANAQSTRMEVRVPRPLAGLGSHGTEAEADEHRLVLQDHPETVGHAVSDSPLGPFVKDGDPVLATNELAAGPGHCQLFKEGDQWWMVYHAWVPGHVGDSASGRQMWLSKVSFDGETVEVQPPVEHPLG